MNLYVSVLNWIVFSWCGLSQNKKLYEKEVVELEGNTRAFLLCTVKIVDLIVLNRNACWVMIILVLNTLSCWPCTKNSATMSHQDMYACDMLNLGLSSLMFSYASKGDLVLSMYSHICDTYWHTLHWQSYSASFCIISDVVQATNVLKYAWFSWSRYVQRF